MPEVRLHINGKAYGGWESIDIDRSIDQLSGSYEITMSEQAPDSTSVADIVTGEAAAISIDNEKVITGYIDDVECAHSKDQHTVTIRGRDKAEDLVDCSAIFKSGQWNDQDMLSIVRDLVKPFGITVSANTDVGKPFTVWNIEPGETVFENIDKMARHRGVLVVSNGIGGIVLTAPSSSRVKTSLELGKNIIEGTATLSHAQRYQTYIVMGQRAFSEDNQGADATELQGTATDAVVKRYRPLIEVFEDAGADLDVLRKRAAWRRNVNAGRAQQATITTDSWTHADGLWHPNRLVLVKDEKLRMKQREVLIVGVRHRKNMKDGTTTQIKVAPRAAYLIDATPEDSFQ